MGDLQPVDRTMEYYIAKLDPKRDYGEHSLEEIIDMVRGGLVEISMGWGDGQPVLRDISSRNFMKGTGRVPAATDEALIAGKYTHRRTRAYKQFQIASQEVLKAAIPITGNPDKWGSLEWIIERGLEAAEGKTIKKRVTCPCGCDYSFDVSMYKAPDVRAIQTILDHRLGKPKETSEINVRSEEIVLMLNERRDADAIEVYDINEEQVAERRKALEE